MKVGTDNRRNLYILIALALVALYAASHYYFGKPTVSANTPVPGVTAPTAKKPVATTRTVKKRKRPPLVASLDPTLRLDLLRASEDQEYTGGKRNIFQSQMEDIPKPIEDGRKKNPIPAPPPPIIDPGPPPPPPIPLKFYGFSSRQGEAKQAFLSSGDDVFIGKEGEVINRRYRIVRINAPSNAASVEIEDVLNNNKQVIPLTPG